MPSLTLGFELPKVVLFRSLVLLMLFVFVWKTVKLGKVKVLSALKADGVKSILLGFLVLLAVGSVFSIAPMQSFWGSYYRMQGVYMLLHYFLFFMMLVLNFHNESVWKKARAFLMAGLIIAIVYGILQRFGMMIGWYDLHESSLGRVFSTFGHPNYFAYYIVLLFFLFCRQKKWIFSLGFVLSALAALFLTESRGAAVGLMMGLGMYLLLAGRITARKLWTWIGAALPVLMIAGGAVFGSAMLAERSIQWRLEVWGRSLKMIGENLFFGNGIETFGMAFQKFMTPDILALELFDVVPDRAHNVFVEIGAGLGLVGILFFVYALVKIFKLGMWGMDNATRERKFEIAGILSGLFAFLVACLFGFGVTAHYEVVAFLLAYLLFLISDGSIEKPSHFPGKKLFAWLVGIFVLALIVFENLFYLGADYFATQELSSKNLNLAITLRPDQSHYNFIMSSMLYEIGDYDNAIIYIEDAGEFGNYQEGFYYLMKGKILAKTGGDYEAVFEKGVEIAPTYPPLWLLWGISDMDVGAGCEAAMEKFNKYLEISPDSWKKDGSEEQRLFYKNNPNFDLVFEYIDKCD